MGSTLNDLHFATAFEAVADRIGNRTALVCGNHSQTWQAFDERAARLARFLVERGVSADAKVGLYLHNSNEYLEAQFAIFKVRGVPVNVNYRYKADELVYLLENSDAEVVFFQACYAMRIWEIYKRVPGVKAWVQIDDGTESVLNFAVDYEQMIRDHAPMDRIARDSTDRYMLYTGGTTGMPKGVMYEQGQFVRAMLANVRQLGLDVPRTIDEITATVDAIAAQDATPTTLAACPLMHGTGMWIGAMAPLLMGGTVVTINKLGLEPDLLWGEVERLRVTDVVIVGDAFAKPMLKALDDAVRRNNAYDISSLRQITSSGVMWSAEVKQALLEHHDMTLLDTMGSTEGGMGSSVVKRGEAASTAKFKLNRGVKVFTDDGHEVEPGSGEIGKLATRGLVPVGYYKDPEKSAATFPVIDGVRYSIPGDYATVAADGTITLLGRGSLCINTAGEKVYPEEVEEAVKRHPGIDDCLVVGVADDRFGQRVVAIAAQGVAHGAAQGAAQGAVQSAVDEAALIEHTKEHLAGYKVPKQVIFVDRVRRAANGKADYKWAQRVADNAA